MKAKVLREEFFQAFPNINSGSDSHVYFVASNGVVLATENKHKSILYEEHSVHKVEMVTNHIGMIYSGEYRILELKGESEFKGF